MKTVETLPPAPRAVEVRPSYIVGRVLLWLLLTASLLGFPYLANRTITRLRTLMTNGKTLDADLIRAYVSQGKSTSYHMDVSFSVGGKSYEGSFYVPPEFYGEYQNASTVPVVTMPADPGNFEIGSVDQDRIDSATGKWAVGGGAICLLFLILAPWFEWELRKQRELLAHGEETMAEVLGAKYTSGKSSNTVVTFRFQSTFGPHTQNVTLTGNKVMDFPDGLEFPLLYSRADERRAMALFQMKMVKVVGQPPFLTY